jgi:ribosomal protein S18 acetylase RimI-like enzyme
MSDWQLRSAEEQDAERLAGFWRDRYGETFAHLYPEADLSAFYAATYNTAKIAAEIADPGYTHVLALAQDDHRILGAMKGGAVGLPIPETNGLWELHRLYLTRETQGSGLADALMAIAQQTARTAKADAMVLGVFSENHRAQRFYAKHGFEKIGAYKFVVGQTLDDEWIMRAPLG